MQRPTDNYPIRGWLLVFVLCQLLIVALAVWGLFLVAGLLEDPDSRFWKDPPPFLRLMVVCDVLTLALIIVCVPLGLDFMAKRAPMTIVYWQRLPLVIAAFAVVDWYLKFAFMPAFVEALTYEQQEAILRGNHVTLAGALVGTIAWSMYWRYSRRVQRTFVPSSTPIVRRSVGQVGTVRENRPGAGGRR